PGTGLGEAGLDPGQASHFVGGRAEGGGGQAEHLIPGAKALLAGRAVVVVALQPQGADQGDDGFAAEGDALGGFAAAGAGTAAPLIPLFFRSARAACKTPAPRRGPRSRTSNSVAPRRWRSSLLAIRRARWRASSSKAAFRRSKRAWASASCSGVRCSSAMRSLCARRDFGVPQRQRLVSGISHLLSRRLPPAPTRPTKCLTGRSPPL